MGFRHIVAAAVIFASLAAGRAGAAIIFNSGTLHASSSAFGGSVTDTPPDVVMSTPSGTISSSVTAPPLTASISTTFSMPASTMSVSGLSSDMRTTSGSTAAGSASGTVSFTETGTESLTGTITRNGQYIGAGVTVTNASNQVLMTMSAQGDQTTPVTPPVTFTLAPGTYSLNWNCAGQFIVGTAGNGSFGFGLAQAAPEPASLAAVALPALLLIRGGRRRQRGAVAA